MIDSTTPGRGSRFEVKELEYGMDFRKPEYRREVFLRFYEFHLKYRAHPGGVYFLLPALAKEFEMTEEQQLWFAFINGNTQNPVTSLIIFKKFSDYAGLNLEELAGWFTWSYPNLMFDTDRRHHKKFFLKSVETYRKEIGLNQGERFREMFWKKDPAENFKRGWTFAEGRLYSFGRLSSWSYLEYIRVCGFNLAPGDLMLRDISGSCSHRNGLCKVLGRDDLDWHRTNPSFAGNYSQPVLSWLEQEAVVLLAEARQRMRGKDYEQDVNNFTLESALCTYKSMHREDRRYPGVYLDMLWDRITKTRKVWEKHEYLSVFEKIRKTHLPEHLRIEDNPKDVGLKPEKQNHFRETGEMIMMDQEWPCFKNAYNDRVK